MSRVLPILFNTEMVRAILDGRKTATRRVIKNLDIEENNGIVTLYEKNEDDAFCVSPLELAKKEMSAYCQYQPGDILYVRETYKRNMDGYSGIDFGGYIYKADCHSGFKDLYNPWRPSIHMPKEAARIWLKVLDVRVEQIKDMTLDDFLCEGITLLPESYNDPENAYQQAKGAFLELIKRIYPDCTEDSWFWVIEFERCEKPEPCILKGVEPAEEKRPCIGYALSETDDEPCEMCKGCKQCTGNDEFEQCEKQRSL